MLRSVILLIAGWFMFTTVKAQAVKAENTTTSLFITNDSDLLGANRDEIRLCQDLLNSASQRIQRNFPEADFSKLSQPGAIAVLATIDSIFTEYRFLFYTDPKNPHFDFLTFAFRDLYPSDRYLLMEHNLYREAYWTAHKGENCRLIDCDLYCFIYLGIAEMNGLPLTMIELPEHNFIRWNFEDGGHINWEAIEGAYHPRDNTLSCYYHLSNLNRSYYLRPWPITEVKSYYYTLRGVTYDYNKKYSNPAKAKRDYETAIRYSSNRAVTFNNMVWLYVVTPEFDASFNFPVLLAMTDSAISKINDRNYYDTRAGLYAQAGDFKKAVAAEEQGIKTLYDPDNVLKDCEEHLEWFKKKMTIREGKKQEEKVAAAPRVIAH
ncbi:tetratricopeptide repeat protein [Flavitalea flava]